MYVAMGSGVALALVYNVNRPFESLQIIMLSNPGATFIRGIHYWSSQLFLVLTGLHFADRLSRRGGNRISFMAWLQVSFILPTVLFLMISGFILKGDRAGLLAGQVLRGLLGTLPAVGHWLDFLVLGGSDSFQVIYLHHIATASLLIVILTIRHGERVLPEARSLVYILGLSMIMSVVFTPGLLPNGAELHVKGPWYFVGLQQILHWCARPLWIVISCMVAFVLFCLLPFLPVRIESAIKGLVVAALFVYLVLTVIGMFFTGADWQFALPWARP